MGGRLRVAFVGNGRKGPTIPKGYVPTFVQFHAELPFYYARYSPCDVDFWIEDLRPEDRYEMDFSFIGGGRLRVDCDLAFIGSEYDVVVHWRKWFPQYYAPGANNVILSQDHSYGPEWLSVVREAHDLGRVGGVLVFPRWHCARVYHELSQAGLGGIPLISGLTLGVDIDVYHPDDGKDPFHLLWASDPGRGLQELIPIFLRLRALDRRFRLTVTYPDYVSPAALTTYASFLSQPGVQHLPSVRNGRGLWDLFNRSGVLAYPSTFDEPSSRCHRQAMAAASLVLYPPDRGTPSDLIEDGITGIVERSHLWPELIRDHVLSGKWAEIGQNARVYAISESWQVQARRFHKYFSERVG